MKISAPTRLLCCVRIPTCLPCMLPQTFKVLKHGGTDYNLLKTWCLLGFLRAFEEYFEASFFSSFIGGKCRFVSRRFSPPSPLSCSLEFPFRFRRFPRHLHITLLHLCVPRRETCVLCAQSAWIQTQGTPVGCGGGCSRLLHYGCEADG